MAAKFNQAAYGKLLARALPRVIQTDKEHERMIDELEKLDIRDETERLTPEERSLADLMMVLIQHYDDVHYPIEKGTPVGMLRHLMEARSLRQRDLIPIFGSSSVVSAVLKGKRSITKAHARKLAEFFHVSASLFI